MAKQPTIQINIGTIEVTAHTLDKLTTDIKEKVDISMCGHEGSLSNATVESIIDILRERVAGLENRLDTQDEPLRDIIDEVTHGKPDLNKDLDDIKKQLDAAELEEIVIQNT